MTQFVRKLDHMGRIVLPAEYRKKTGIDDLAEVMRFFLKNNNPFFVT